MGIRLIVEVLDHAPTDLTGAELIVLLVLAENANDATREAWPGMDVLARRGRLAPHSVAGALRRLATRDLDVRVPLGKDKNGKPFFAARGRQTTYRLPRFERGPAEDPIPAKGSQAGPLSEEKGVPARTERGPQEDRKGSPPGPPPPHIPSLNPQEERVGETDDELKRLVDRLDEITNRKPGQTRTDVEQICTHLADRIAANGSKRPTIGKTWRDAARLLIDADGRTVEQIIKAIDWCQDDEFWRGNVMSMPKLRKHYDRLRLAAKRGQNGRTLDNRFVSERAAADNPFAPPGRQP